MAENSRMTPEMACTVGRWDYICCHCIVRIKTGFTCSGPECAACGNLNLRFVHTLEHLEDGRQIEVGIECASALLEDRELPRLAENEVKRKEGWRIRYRNPGRCVCTPQDLENRGKL